MLNAFKYTKLLEEAGFSREQAEIQLQAITEIVEGELATKQDLVILKNDLGNVINNNSNEQNQIIFNFKQEIEIKFREVHHKIEKVQSDLEQKIEKLNQKFDYKIEQLESRLIIKLGAFLVICFTALITMMRMGLTHS